MTHKLACWNDETGEEHIYTVKLVKTGNRNSDGKDECAYAVYEGFGNLVTAGKEYWPSPLRPPTGKQAACDLIVLLNLGMADEDEEMGR